MLIRDLILKAPSVLDENGTVDDALDLLKDDKPCVIVQNNRVAGIVQWTDLISQEALSRKEKAIGLASSPAMIVNESISLSDAVRVAMQNRFAFLILTSQEGEFVGIVESMTLLKRMYTFYDNALSECKSLVSLEQNRLKQTLDMAPLIFLSLDTQGTIQYLNRKGCTLLGVEEEYIRDQKWFDTYVSIEQKTEAKAIFDSVMGSEIPMPEYYENTIVTVSGERRTIGWHNALREDEEGRIIGSFSYGEDITEHIAARQKLKEAAIVYDTTSEGIIITDSGGKIVGINNAFSNITGYSIEEVLGKKPSILKSEHHSPIFFEQMWNSLQQYGHWEGEVWNQRKNGTVYPVWLNINTAYDETGEIENFVGIFLDISKLKESEMKLEQIVHFDPLTKLPNRLLLQARLQHAIEKFERQETKIAVIHLDMNHFKDINESYGYGVGDKVLVKISKKLSDLLHQENTLARIGGDEFVILVEDIEDVLEIEPIVKKIQDAFEEAIVADGLDFRLKSSIGIAIFPDDGEDAETILKHADLAQNRSKMNGGEGYCYFSAQMGAQVFERVLLERELRRAVEERQFTVYYQPQIDLQTGVLVGAEALVRWKHPMMGLVRPDVFISLAEHNHLIVPMGEQVLEEACRRAKEWIDSGWFDGRISVNVSGRQFERHDVVDTIRRIVEKSGLDTRYLELEITESVMMNEPNELMKKFSALKELGIEIAIDDFGTGYSSLSYLKQFPIDKLKIDQSFVRGLLTSEQDYAIVKAIIAMSDVLGLKTIAEGIEEKEHGEILQKMGCMQGQGYFYARPLEKEAFENYMKQLKK